MQELYSSKLFPASDFIKLHIFNRFIQQLQKAKVTSGTAESASKVIYNSKSVLVFQRAVCSIY